MMNFNLLPSIVSMIIAAILAYNGIPNWGWFIVLAIIFIPSANVNDNE